ncbi:MAG: flagellar biosynthetic protein FliO [Planctomycetota bacterium]
MLKGQGDRPAMKATLVGGGLLLVFALAGASMLGPSEGGAARAPAKQPAATPAANAAVPGGETPEAAAPTTGRPRRALEVPQAGGASLPRLFGGLLVVLVLGVVAVVGGRVFLKRTRLAPSSERVLKIVDALPLGPRKQIYVVEVQGRRLVLGAGPETITLLSEFEDRDLGLDQESTPETENDFAERLLRESAAGPAVHPEFVR